MVDLSLMLRAARRHAGLSQREMSQAAGTDFRTLERLESGASVNVTLTVLLRLLGAAGASLALIDAAGAPIIDPDPVASAYRDAAGRRQPAHLVTRVVRGLDFPSWKNHDWRKPTPGRTFESRAITKFLADFLADCYSACPDGADRDGSEPAED